MRIVAVDPGQTTGVVCGSCVDGHFEMSDCRQFSLSQLGRFTKYVRVGLSGGSSKVDDLRHSGLLGEWVLVVESFVLYAGTGGVGGKWNTGLSPIYVMGWLSGNLGFNERLMDIVVWQGAGDAKGVVTDDRLRTRGLWIVGKQHARDAARHAELWCRKNG